MPRLSLVIPTLNEEENIVPLVREISKSIKKDYEIIFIDDKSTDGTIKEIKKIVNKYPIRVYLKKGEKGKTQSLLEGFKYAKYEILGMIDADLQYPPSYIPEMLKIIEKNGADIVVTSRKEYKAPILRRILSFIGRIFIFLLFGLNFDTQSGLKLFKKSVYENVKITTKNEWTFDLDFLIKAKKQGYRIRNIYIKFHPRTKGESKVYNNKGTKRNAYREIIRMRFGV